MSKQKAFRKTQKKLDTYKIDVVEFTLKTLTLIAKGKETDYPIEFYTNYKGDSVYMYIELCINKSRNIVISMNAATEKTLVRIKNLETTGWKFMYICELKNPECKNRFKRAYKRLDSIHQHEVLESLINFI